MHAYLRVPAALILASVTAPTRAQDHAWFTLESSSAPVNVLSQGPGQTLVIEQLSPGNTTLTIGYNFTADLYYLDYPGVDTMASYSIKLEPDVNNGSQGVLFANPVNISPTYNGSSFAQTGPTLHYGIMSNNLTGIDGLVLTFEVTIDNRDLEPSITNFFGEWGDMHQVFNNGWWWYGHAGPNPPNYGYIGVSFGSLPVISVAHVPEPATAWAALAGSLLVIRRRR